INGSRTSRGDGTSQQRNRYQNCRHAYVSCWIGRADDDKTVQQTRYRERCCEARGKTDADNPQALPVDHPQNVRVFRAQRDADSDLIRFLAHDVRQYPVDAHYGEAEAEGPEHSGECSAGLEEEQAVGGVQSLPQCLHLKYRKRRSQGADGALDLRDHRGRIACGAQFQGVQSVLLIVLQVRYVEEWGDGSSDALIPRVSGHADHLHRMRWIAAHGELLANGVLIRPELLRHRLTDDGDVEVLLAIGFREAAALQQRNLHSAEILCSDQVFSGTRSGLSRRWLVAGNREGIVTAAVDVAHGNICGDGGRDDAGKRANSLQKIGIEIAALGIVIADFAGVHGKRQDMRWIEAEVGVFRLGQAAREQPGNDEQHERAADLEHDQRIAEFAAAAGDAAPPFVEE